MTDERLFELMGWPPGFKIEPGDMACRVRVLVVTAEREAIIAEIPGGCSVDPQWVCDMIRARGN